MSRLTAAEIAEIKRGRDQGESMSSIARRLGRNPSTIKSHLSPIKDPRPKPLEVYKCPGCPLLFAVPRHARVYCTPDCRENHRARKFEADRAYFLAELDWIAGTDTWENIAHRLGYKNTQSLARRLVTLGEYELARKVEKVDLPTPRQWAA